MAILDLFSKRQKRLRGEVPDVYVYDVVPKPLRVQIVHIFNRFQPSQILQGHILKDIVDTLRVEYGVAELPVLLRYDDPCVELIRNKSHSYRELIGFFLSVENAENALDVIEICMFVLNDSYLTAVDSDSVNEFHEKLKSYIDEINDRFKESGAGYQFENGRIIKIDSQMVHQEIVKPALHLLSGRKFSGPQQEFLSAHAHYRNGNYKETLNDCLKSIESTIKVICNFRKWTYAPQATAKQLIDICFQNNLIPSYWQNHFSSLRSMLESSVPTARNKMSGHGQGAQPIQVPAYLASYMLHMTASTILFLVKANENFGK